MRKLLLLVLLAIAGGAAWYFFKTKPAPKNETPQLNPLTVSKHSDSFNVSVNNALDQYFALTEGLVNWDTNTINQKADSLDKSLQTIHFDELKKDSSIFQTAVSYKQNFINDLQTIRTSQDISEKRKAYNSLSQNMYDLLRVVKYDKGKVFLQECPMAFNDTEPGLWLSRSGSDEARRNPYLGLHHPKYKSAMLTCGEVKDSLNFK
jgi:hypothetical protein